MAEKMLVSDEFKVFILTDQQGLFIDGGILRVRPFNTLAPLELAALREKAEPLGEAHKIDIVDFMKDDLMFHARETGQAARIKKSVLDQDVQRRLRNEAPPKPRLSPFSPPPPEKPMPRRRLAVMFAATLLAVGGLGITGYNRMQERAAEQAATQAAAVAAADKADADELAARTFVREIDQQDKKQLVSSGTRSFERQLPYYSESDAAFLREVDKGNLPAVQQAVREAKSKEDTRFIERVGSLAMVRAAQLGDLDMIKALHRYGVDVNQRHRLRDFPGETLVAPLAQAVEVGLSLTTDLLLSLKADPNLPDELLGKTPMQIAASSYYDELRGLALMMKLAEAGADMKAQTLYSEYDPLAMSVSRGSIAKADFVLSRLPDAKAAVNKPYVLSTSVTGRNAKGTTLLMLALDQSGYNSKGIPPMAQFLMDKGADIFAKDDAGVAAIHYTAALDQTDVMKLLIKKGVDPWQKTTYGVTPLEVAENTFPHPVDARDYLRKLAKPKAAPKPVLAPVG